MTASAETLSRQAELSLNRREFLNLAWLVSLGFFLVDIAGVTYLFALPRFRAGEFGGDFTVGNAADLPATSDPPENYPKVRFWLSHHEKGLSALYKVCTHLGCLYNWADQENKFICPCHGSQFQRDGTYIRGPAPRSLDRFVIQLLDAQSGEVVAETDPDGNPITVPEGFQGTIKVDTGRRILGQPHG